MGGGWGVMPDTMSKTYFTKRFCALTGGHGQLKPLYTYTSCGQHEWGARGRKGWRGHFNFIAQGIFFFEGSRIKPRIMVCVFIIFERLLVVSKCGACGDFWAFHPLVPPYERKETGSQFWKDLRRKWFGGWFLCYESSQWKYCYKKVLSLSLSLSG